MLQNSSDGLLQTHYQKQAAVSKLCPRYYCFSCQYHNEEQIKLQKWNNTQIKKSVYSRN
jgi:hypothetical protein